MVRRKLGEEKSLPVINFLFPFYIRFNISGTETQKQIFKQYCKENSKEESEIGREIIYRFFNVKNGSQFLNRKVIGNKIEHLLVSFLRDEMGVGRSDFSKWFWEEFERLKQ